MPAYLELARDYRNPPPAGGPYSVTVPGTEQPGRSAIYRHWRFRDGLLKTLDPNVGRVLLEYPIDPFQLTLHLGHERPPDV